MNPAVVEIVFVGKALHPAQPEIAKPYLSSVGIKEYAAISAQSVFRAADLKTVQVHIVLAEGDLQYLVKLRDPCVAGSQQPSPDQWTDIRVARSQLKNHPL